MVILPPELPVLPLHDALPIFPVTTPFPRMKWQEAMDRYGIDRPDTRFGMELIDITAAAQAIAFEPFRAAQTVRAIDRKSTRLNSSHLVISYAVFCLKKKKQKQ